MFSLIIIPAAFWNYDYCKIFENPMIQEPTQNPQRRRRKCVDDAERKAKVTDEQSASSSESNTKRRQRRRNGREDPEGQEGEKLHSQTDRSNEDEEKRIARLEANARRQRLRRENETAEERAARLRANAIRQRKRRQQETPEERAARLQANALRQQRLRSKARSEKQENDPPSLPSLIPPEVNVCIQEQQPPLPFPFSTPCVSNDIFTCQQ
nr:unnamed protein product [Haemonchus contortus]